ncbi:uncharacterized protein LOC105834680 [Monomorium pharaonis]|uniref:uncharacterized protein LOC105834680 n=1 Tax=Monomorium pharaonis TaxID=307658 RepID=UPI0017470DC1|nr:uncharacterized protein LOC105834680 [Monomorium pharaonis]
MFSSSFKKQIKDKMSKWQLFHATDFQSLMYPCFIVCRILGAFPYKINTSTIETSKLYYILSTFLICVFCISELLMLHGIFISKTVSFGDVTARLACTFFIVFGGFTVIITYILSGPRKRVLQAMISLRLSSESYQMLARWIHVKDILITFFIIIQESLFYLKNPSPGVSMFIFSIYISLLTFYMDMQYMNCIWVLKTCFKKINDNLVHVQRIVVNDKQYASRLIYHTQKNQFLLIELKSLKKQHLIVSDTVQMLNVIFSLQLLATTTLTFTEITFHIYSHVLQWQDGLSIILDETYDVFFLTAVVYEFFKLALIVWSCESNKNQAFVIGTTVHDVLNCTSDKQIKEEVTKINLICLYFMKNYIFLLIQYIYMYILNLLLYNNIA